MERLHLPSHGIGHLAPPVSDVGVPQRGCPVEVPPAGLVKYICALAADHHEGVLGDVGHRGEWMPQAAHGEPEPRRRLARSARSRLWVVGYGF